MLDPQDRELLLDALRPDQGAILDRAVGTSFTLDLDALLMAPLAFAFFELDETKPDPMALLAAIQQNAAKMALYCDAAHIKAPTSEQKLFVLLESSLLPVLAPRGGAFHPKFWALRFRHIDGAVSHRLLVLSRNLTFDTSWDLLVRFDQSDDGKLAGGEAASVLRALDQLARSPIARDLAASIAKVNFDVPRPFDGARLFGLGLGNAASPDPITPGRGDRVLVVSPFLTADRLDALAPLGEAARTLVSRPDELARVGGAAVADWGTPLILRDTEMLGSDGTPSVLRGLHAKLVVVDRGERAAWFAGSANATRSAFEQNAETVVELDGARRKVGVGALLSESGKEVRFRTMLEPMPLLDPEPAELTPHEQEEERLDKVAGALCRMHIEARVRTDGAVFKVDLALDGEAPELRPGDRLYARLVTRNLEESLALGRQPAAVLQAARASEITSLVAIRIVGDSDLKIERGLVVLARLIGAPDDRIDRLLIDVIPDSRRFSLLLLLMLAAGDPETETSTIARQMLSGTPPGSATDDGIAMPLFESLVRTSARDPERLIAINTLVERLQRTPEGRERLPVGFDALWAAFRPLLKRGRG